jgi:hypothetical protein
MADTDTDTDNNTKFNLTHVPTHQFVSVLTALASMKSTAQSYGRTVLVGAKGEPDWQKWRVASGSPFSTAAQALSCMAAINKSHPGKQMVIVPDDCKIVCVKYIDPATCLERTRWAVVSDPVARWAKTVSDGITSAYFATKLTPATYFSWN